MSNFMKILYVKKKKKKKLYVVKNCGGGKKGCYYIAVPVKDLDYEVIMKKAA